ncbi:MAG TPA: hypothetical protein VNE62_11660 [Actinomycetota bacterium]|nr:hypothetical protein [Actinomycetota bacterium]
MRPQKIFTAFVAAAVIGTAAPAASAAETCRFDAGISPGASVSKTCEIVNNDPGRDATFYLHVNQASIKVFNASDQDVTSTADGRTFLGFFTLSLATERVLTVSTPTGDESDDADLAKLPAAHKQTCSDRPLTALTGDRSNFDGTYCRIGRVRRGNYASPGFDRRAFTVSLSMADSGDQSRFIGWYMSFGEVITGMVPAASDCAGSCLPVYER